MSLAHWDAIRLAQVGPDGLLEWDKMTNMAVYRGHTKKYLVATSHAGATMHAYGVKVGIHSFGMDNGKPLLSASGFNSHYVTGIVDNTDLYKLMYLTLFGKKPSGK